MSCCTLALWSLFKLAETLHPLTNISPASISSSLETIILLRFYKLKKVFFFFTASTSEIIWQMPFCVWFRCIVRMIPFPSLLEINSAPSIPCILDLSHVFSGSSTMLRWQLSIRYFTGKPEIKACFLCPFFGGCVHLVTFLCSSLIYFLLQYPQRLGDILELYSLLWVMAFASIFFFR